MDVRRRILGTLLAMVLAGPATPTVAQSPTTVPEATQPGVAASDARVPLAVIATGSLPVEGTPWRLDAYRGKQGTVLRAPADGVAAWLTFRAGRLNGSDGCARLVGRYALVGSALDVDLRDARERACGAGPRAVADRLRARLSDASGYRVEPDAAGSAHGQLILRGPGGTDDLRFRLDDLAELEGSEWRLSGYVRAGTRVLADLVQPAVLAFRASRSSPLRRTSSGEAIGSTACNGVVARYERVADRLEMTGLEVTDAPCSPALEAQQATMLEVLAAAPTISLTADTLVLSTTDGDSLDFVTSGAVEETTWQLARLRRPLPPGQLVTLSLAGGSASGEGPCGPYRGSYVQVPPFITFSALSGSGDEACRARKVERLLLDALARTVLWERASDGLLLLDAAGRTVARFERPGIG